MATEYSPIAGIGILLDLGKLKTAQGLEHSCEHPERHGQRYCPRCGAKVWSRPLILSDKVFEVTVELEAMKLPKHMVLGFWDYDNDVWFLGYGVSFDRNEAYGPLPLPDLKGLDETIHEIISSLKSLDDPSVIVMPNSFGFHAAMPGW
ncbi:hypothetical protein CcrC1_gp378 [Caulobacter phage C1]|nr:hypothetical protein CcrC1_gp378 [Caulobacter phage C1]UTU08607.1 hypothetical protein CcrC2_gp379 [Caulobacter phage C2]UTU09122.1 hypothetical protein CcrJ4_gp373 [Caulobacter phage J4]WGN97274.1 hypothetical protein [Bertelyvirus sp.]WGN97792.1 hypothetical protein [Bertelyvirus sp.]